MTRTIGSSTWLDLNVKDLEVAKAFYTGLFGWEYEDLGAGFNHYHLIRNRGALVGGLMDVSGMTCPEGDPLPSTWSVYLLVDDIAARTAKVTEMGGTVIVPPDAMSETGSMSVVLDSTRAGIGLWQPGTLEGFEFTGAPGSPVWFELMTHDFDAASAFYTAVFDAQLVPMHESMDEGTGPDDGGSAEGGGFRYSTNGSQDAASWGMCDVAGQMPEGDGGWRIYLAVETCDAAIEKVTSLGGKLLDGPIDSPFGRIATVADPEGASFQISAMSEAIPEG